MSPEGSASSITMRIIDMRGRCVVLTEMGTQLQKQNWISFVTEHGPLAFHI